MRQVSVQPHFQTFFGDTVFNIAGMETSPRVDSTLPKSPAKGKLQKGDVIVELRVNNDPYRFPSYKTFIDLVHDAGEKGYRVDLKVRRGDRELEFKSLQPNFRLRDGTGKRGIGILLEFAEDRAVVTKVLEGSPAARAGISPVCTIKEIDGRPVTSWFDVHRLLSLGTGSSKVVAIRESDNQPATFTLNLTADELQRTRNICYRHGLLLQESIEPRKTSNPLIAAGWGVTETRDLLLQFYLTLHRLAQGSVSATNFMGPIGIVHAGSFFAFKGWDWLIWFLAMISANLAVVNFLPIPITDGGLFVFLTFETIAGRPLSPRMQAVAQVVGLAIILSVFLLVTYQDIRRFFL
jgi:regulator of sigma E protease